ncbi:MAG: Uma2 family endonuclease [Planctomycetaceae bacterium]
MYSGILRVMSRQAPFPAACGVFRNSGYLMSVTAKLVTASELLANHSRQRCELIRGEVKLMSPAGSRHGWVAASVGRILGNFVLDRKLGHVFGAETGFVIESDPDTVRAPDAAFVRIGRVSGRIPSGYFPGAPDLAVEVVSPGDTSTEVHQKAEQWLRSGASVVWLIDPTRETGAVCRLEDGEFHLRSVRELAAPELLPGFSLPVHDLFE